MKGVGNLSEGRDAEAMKSGYRDMLVDVLELVLDRYEADPGYRFIDTKLNLVTGRDFAVDDPIRGKDTIYSWIQGRGLEALAGHIEWLRGDSGVERAKADRLADRSLKMLQEVFAQMEAIREKNGGRLYFMMTPQGQALQVDEGGTVVPHELRADAPSSFSDLFYVKGMAAAANLLGMEDRLAESREWFKRICTDILEENFVSDQQLLDPKNTAVKKVEGRYSQGVFMIALGAFALHIRCGGGEEFKRIGLWFLDHILDLHIDLDGDSAVSRKYDMWEFVDENGAPFIDEGNTLMSDPGHACEFVGLSLCMLSAIERHHSLDAGEEKQVARCKQALPGILERNFANGFSPRGYGIAKAVDLVSRRPLNSDMPWWSLPETMRAAALVCRMVPEARRRPFDEMIFQCSEAFTKYYVKPELNSMAVQTLDETGKPVDAIPATPDADPGYHTGLSLIDFLAAW